MTINVDDHGDQHPELPLTAHLAADWVDIADAIDHHHPDVAAEHANANATEALARFGEAAASSGVPVAYLAALRGGRTRCRYKVPVTGDTTVSIALTAPGPGHPPYDTRRELASWQQLRRVVADVHARGDTTVLHPDLPAEVAIAVWDSHGHRFYVARPGTPSSVIRAARPRYRWYAITSTPLIAAIAEKLGQFTAATGQVTATATAAVGAFVVPMPATPPPTTAAPIEAQDLFARDHHIPPSLPLILPRPSTSPTLPPLPDDAAPQDTRADTDTPAAQPPAGPAATTPITPSPTPAPTKPAAPRAVPDPVPSATERPETTSEPPQVPDAVPVESPTPAPTPTVADPPQPPAASRPVHGKRLGHQPGHGPKRGHPHGR